MISVHDFTVFLILFAFYWLSVSPLFSLIYSRNRTLRSHCKILLTRMLQKYERYDGSKVYVTIFFDFFSYSCVKFAKKEFLMNLTLSRFTG
jgi:hypothetical protein